MKRRLLLSVSVCFAVQLLNGQGLINNGATITITNGAYIGISGGTAGDFTNQLAGTVTNNGTIWLEGDWTNSGSTNVFTSNAGTVQLTGGAQNIGGTTQTYFNNLTLAGSGTKTLNINTLVGGGYASPAGVLSLGTQPLNLNSNTLRITNPLATAITNTTGYIISETNASVNPSRVQWDMGTTLGPHIFPFGVSGTLIPFTFNVTAGAAGGTVTVATRASAPNNTPWAGASSVAAAGNMYCPVVGGDGSLQTVLDRWWDITTTPTSTSYTANLTFTYRGVENTISGIYQTGTIAAQHWDGFNWQTPVGVGTGVLAGTGTVTVAGANSFSPWVLVALPAPLPVEILSYSSTCEDYKTILKWETGTEQNNSHFEIQKSTGGDFVNVATIPATTNPAPHNTYSWQDVDASEGTAYYRLVQQDINGSREDLGVIAHHSCDAQTSMNVYPNPATSELTVFLSSEQAYSGVLRLINSVGQVVLTRNINIEKGNNSLFLDLFNVPAGIYQAEITGSNTRLTSRIVRN